MSTPILSKNAVLLKDATIIGFVRDVEVTPSSDAIKEYFMGNLDPGILEYGQKTYAWGFTKGYVDKTYGELLTGGATFTLELRPEGTGAGKPKITLSNCVMTRWRVRFVGNSVVFEDCSGEAKSMAFGVQA